MAPPFTLNETILQVARQHLAHGAFGVVTLAEAVGVHYTTIYRWIQRGQDALSRPETERSPEDTLCAELAQLKNDPPQVYTAAWKAILNNLQGAEPDLSLARWVVEHFDEGHLAKLELTREKEEEK